MALILAPGPELLLVRRAERESDRWSGHMALPGGRREAADRDLLDTAIRETREETAVALARDGLTGTLEDLKPRAPTLPPILVRPFVFRLAEKPATSLSEELTGAFWFGLDELKASASEAPVQVAGAPTAVPAFIPREGCVIWGMTHRILTCFFAVPGLYSVR